MHSTHHCIHSLFQRQAIYFSEFCYTDHNFEGSSIVICDSILLKAIFLVIKYTQNSSIPVHKLDSFHTSGHEQSWVTTELNSMVRFSDDLMGKFDQVLSS